MRLQTPDFDKWLAAEKVAQAAEAAFRSQLVRAARDLPTTGVVEMGEAARDARRAANALFLASLQETKAIGESISQACRSFSTRAQQMKASARMFLDNVE